MTSKTPKEPVLVFTDPVTGKRTVARGFNTSRIKFDPGKDDARHDVGRVQDGVGVVTTSNVHDCVPDDAGRCKVCESIAEIPKTKKEVP